MTRPASGLALLMSYAVLSLWVPERWAWGLFQFAVFAAAAGWVVWQMRNARPIATSVWLAPLAAAAVWGLAQLAAGQTVYRWETWNATLNWATYLVLLFLALQVFRDSGARLWFLRGALYFGVTLAVLSTVQMFTSRGKIFWLFPSGYTDYVLGPFVYHNEYAAFMEMILPLALWQALDRKARGKAFGFCVMAGAIFASVVAGASRTGAVILCLETVAILVLAFWRSLIPAASVVRGFAVVALSAVIFTAIVGWDPLWRRFLDQESYSGRREFFLSSTAMVHDRPWMGFGLGTWPHVYPRYALYDDGLYVTHAHNDWAEWAAEGGLAFAAIMLSLAALALPGALRSLWGVGLLAVWLHCTVEYIFHQRPGLGACFFVLLGALAMEVKASPIARRPPAGSPARRAESVKDTAGVVAMSDLLEGSAASDPRDRRIVVSDRAQHTRAGEVDDSESGLEVRVVTPNQEILTR